MPVVCLHPAGGTVDVYAPLAVGLPGHRIYAIPSRHCDTPDDEAATIEQMAEDYAAEIDRALPDGPYALFGWSLGALTAFAIAHELERRARAVALIAMVEPRWGAAALRHAGDVMTATVRRLVHRHGQRVQGLELVRELRELETATARDATSVLAWCVQRGLLPDGAVTAGELDRMARLLGKHRQLVVDYQPPEIRARLLVWWAGERGFDWATRTRATASDASLDATHFTIMRSPHVDRIASDLQSQLGRCS
jgi:thioesterase domain-containing protein